MSSLGISVLTIIMSRSIIGILDPWMYTLQWRHNGCHGLPNHRRLNYLLNRWFSLKSRKTSKLLVTGLCVRGIHRSTVNSPHKGPVTRKMSPFDDVIMISSCCFSICSHDFPILNWPENLYTKYVHIGPDSGLGVFLLEPREKPLYMYYQELRSCLHEGPPDKYTPKNNWLFILSSGCACLKLVSVHCRIDVFSVFTLALAPFTNTD